MSSIKGGKKRIRYVPVPPEAEQAILSQPRTHELVSISASGKPLSPRNVTRDLVVRTATILGHGCQIVISAVAETEATRLAPQATVIEPTEMTDELTEKLCSVDGAVLLDPSNKCHAFGLILDGVVSARGDKNRGSVERINKGRISLVDGILEVQSSLLQCLHRRHRLICVENLE